MVASSATGDSTPSLRSAIMRGGFLKFIPLARLFWWLGLVCFISIHTLNRSHLKEHQKKVEQDPDFVRKKLKLNADGTPREKVSQ